MLFAGVARGQTIGSNAGYPTLSAALAMYPSFATITGGSIEIDGTFSVDNNQTWTLSAVTVNYSTSTSFVEVLSGSTMSATSASKFQPSAAISTMGTAIVARAGSKLVSTACDYFYCSTALVIASGASPVDFSIKNNRFLYGTTGVLISGPQNVTHQIIGNQFFGQTNAGIRLVGCSNLNIASNSYSDFSPGSGGNYIMFGIDIFTGCWNIKINGGTFSNVLAGVNIAPTGGATGDIFIENITQFTGKNGVKGVQTYNQLTVKNCNFRGCIEDAILLEYHEFFSSLPIAKRLLTIESNVQLTSATRSGVRIKQVVGFGKVVVLNNHNINPESVSTATPNANYGIAISDCPNSTVLVEDNWIFGGNTGTMAGGIYLNGCRSQNRIKDNRVDVVKSPAILFAIGVNNSKNVQIVENEVNMHPNPSLGSSWLGRGIVVENSPTGILLCCNSLDKAGSGVWLSGSQNDYQIFNTTFNAHDTALYYKTVVTANSLQTHNGNFWTTGGSNADGYFNGNVFWAQGAFYDVLPSHLANTSKIFVLGGTASDWFAVPGVAGSETSCSGNSSTTYCDLPALGVGNPPEDNSLTDIDEWALDEPTDDSYEVVHANAQRYLFDKQSRYPSLQNASTAFAAFYSNTQSGNIGKLYGVENGFATLRDLPTNIASSCLAATADIVSLNEEIAEIDVEIESASSSELPDLQALRSDKVGILNTALQTSESCQAAITTSMSTKIADLQNLNNAILPTTYAEEDEQSMNTLLLAALAANDWDFSSSEKAAIDFVASYCPEVGGAGVHLARFLQENYRVPDWSGSNCSFVENRNSTRPANKPGFALFPNPTSGEFQMLLQKPATNATIFDIAGKSVKTIAINEGQSEFYCSVDDLMAGSYFVQVFNADKSYLVQKLTIIR